MPNTTIDARVPDLADLRTIITRYAARSPAGGSVVVFFTLLAGPPRVAANRVSRVASD